MATAAYRDLIDERKAKLVSDTGKTLLPDRTLVREWTKIPRHACDEIRDYLLGLSTVASPKADQKTYTGTWRTYNVTVGYTKTEGWSVRQALSLGYYTASLPTAIALRQRDLEGTPFAAVTLKEYERVVEYRNIARDSVAALKPAIGSVVGTERITAVESQMQEDGSAKIFATYQNIVYPNQTPATGGGLALVWSHPDLPAEEVGRTYHDLDDNNLTANLEAMKAAPDGYAVRRIYATQGREKGVFALVQELVKVEAHDAATPFLTSQSNPGAETIRIRWHYFNILNPAVSDSTFTTPAAGYIVTSIDIQERGQGYADVVVDEVSEGTSAIEHARDGVNAYWPRITVTWHHIETDPGEGAMTPEGNWLCVSLEKLDPDSAAPSWRRAYKQVVAAAYAKNDAGILAGVRNKGEDDESSTLAYHGITNALLSDSLSGLQTQPDSGTYSGWAVVAIDVRDHGDGTWSIYRTLAKDASTYADWVTIHAKSEMDTKYDRVILKRIDDSTIRVMRTAYSRIIATTRSKKLVADFTVTGATVEDHLSTGAGTFTSYWRDKEKGGKIYEYREEVVKAAWYMDSISVLNVSG